MSAPFWEAASEGRLLYQRCPSCGHRQFYPRALCTACGATPEWAEASGRGEVHTFTVVRQHGGKAFREELPYVVAIVELSEGVRMMGTLTDVAPEGRSRRHARRGLRGARRGEDRRDVLAPGRELAGYFAPCQASSRSRASRRAVSASPDGSLTGAASSTTYPFGSRK